MTWNNGLEGHRGFLLLIRTPWSLRPLKTRRALTYHRGQGSRAAQNVANKKPAAVLTGNCGPKAFKVLQAAGIEVVIGINGKIKDAVKAYLSGEHKAADEANVEGHWM